MGRSVRSPRMPAPPGRRRGRITQSDPSGRSAAEPRGERLPPGDDQLLVRSTAPAIGHTEQTGPSARLGNRCRNPSRPAAGSCSSGARIRSPTSTPGAGPGSEKRWGAPRAAHPGRGVIALGDDSGNPPADAGQWAPCALGHVVVHHSSSIAASNLAAPRAPATPANKTITMILRKHTGFIHPFRMARC